MVDTEKIGVLAVVAVLGIWAYFLLIHDPAPNAAPDNPDPYIGFHPGERLETDAAHNASCLNQHLPRGLTAFDRNDTYEEQYNFTHKKVDWRQEVVIERRERQQAADPSVIRVHEDTLRGCEELRRETSGIDYVREIWTNFNELEQVPCPHAVYGYDECYRSPWNSSDRESVIAVTWKERDPQ